MDGNAVFDSRGYLIHLNSYFVPSQVAKAEGAIIVYDVTSMESFENAKTLWISPLIQNYVRDHDDAQTRLLVANKIDSSDAQEISVCDIHAHTPARARKRARAHTHTHPHTPQLGQHKAAGRLFEGLLLGRCSANTGTGGAVPKIVTTGNSNYW